MQQSIGSFDQYIIDECNNVYTHANKFNFTKYHYLNYAFVATLYDKILVGLIFEHAFDGTILHSQFDVASNLLVVKEGFGKLLIQEKF